MAHYSFQTDSGWDNNMAHQNAEPADYLESEPLDDARCCQCEITGCHGNAPGAQWRDELSCSGRNGERDLVGVEESQGLKVCQECMDKYIWGGYPVNALIN